MTELSSVPERTAWSSLAVNRWFTGASAAQQPEAKSDSKTVGGSIQPRHPGARAGTRPRKLAGAGNMVTLEGYLDPHAEARGRVL
jgi:hypothetical protein